MKFVGILLLVACSGALASKIEPQLLSKLEAGNSANIFISFQAGTSNLLKSLTTKFASRSEKATKIKSLLLQHAKVTQAEILAFLEKREAKSIRSFWISNQIYIENASLKLVQALTNFDKVSAITEEVIVTIDAPTESFPSSVHAVDDLTYGLKKIEVQGVWDLGTQGEGVLVGGIDTGVRGTHEALRDNFIGENGWYDPTRKASKEPMDDQGHGTHTMATAVGSHGVGVAPGAKWMACKGCTKITCPGRHLLACGEFMACPNDGKSTECGRLPKVIINSWGGKGGNTFFYPVIETWKAEGIIPVFANGNRRDEEPICGGAGSPGDHPDVIAVGNTNRNDGLTPSSQQGPTTLGKVKPDVSAPGSLVISAHIKSDNHYEPLTGTSMACPHVAGVVALLASKKPDLTKEEALQLLIDGSEQAGLRKPGNNCGGLSEDIFPNHAFGHGRVSALKSFQLLKA